MTAKVRILNCVSNWINAQNIFFIFSKFIEVNAYLCVFNFLIHELDIHQKNKLYENIKRHRN